MSSSVLRCVARTESGDLKGSLPPPPPPSGPNLDFEVDPEDKESLGDVVALATPREKAKSTEETRKRNLVCSCSGIAPDSEAKQLSLELVEKRAEEVEIDAPPTDSKELHLTDPAVCEFVEVSCAEGRALDLPIRHDDSTTRRVEDATHVAILSCV